MQVVDFDCDDAYDIYSATADCVVGDDDGDDVVGQYLAILAYTSRRHYLWYLVLQLRYMLTMQFSITSLLLSILTLY